MLTAIKGYYESGQIFLKEQPPVSAKTEVIVTFLQEESKLQNDGKRIPGALKGKVLIPDDFNEPIEDMKDYF